MIEFNRKYADIFDNIMQKAYNGEVVGRSGMGMDESARDEAVYCDSICKEFGMLKLAENGNGYNINGKGLIKMKMKMNSNKPFRLIYSKQKRRGAWEDSKFWISLIISIGAALLAYYGAVKAKC